MSPCADEEAQRLVTQAVKDGRAGFGWVEGQKGGGKERAKGKVGGGGEQASTGRAGGSWTVSATPGPTWGPQWEKPSREATQAEGDCAPAAPGACLSPVLRDPVLDHHSIPSTPPSC